MKIYDVVLKNGAITPLFAENNREAMKLAGQLTKFYGDIRKVVDFKTKQVVISNF